MENKNKVKICNFQEALFPGDIAVSLFFVIARFKSIMKKYGEQLVLKKDKFKKAREMWETAIFLLGLSKITEKRYWLMPEYKETTPDTYGIFLKPYKTKNNIKMEIPIEVTEWEGHAAGDLVSTIEKKLADKDYPKNYRLLVYVKHEGDTTDFAEVFDKISLKEII